MTFFSQLLLAQGDTQPPQGGIFGNQFLFFGLMIVMFYFLLIRPQQRQRKELEKRLAALQKGDEVVTTAGIHGIVHNVKDKTVVLKVAEGTMIEFDKPAVATVLKKESAAAVSK
ncbi:preprotein translocase subunit YajC [Luteolibacter sp. Populi]|uniref:preprotein translocase subunit YajC n=1 Tax=Luteolibacter sp. Populi TaxID=3230487 RepID=UPI003467825C